MCPCGSSRCDSEEHVHGKIRCIRYGDHVTAPCCPSGNGGPSRRWGPGNYATTVNRNEIRCNAQNRLSLSRAPEGEITFRSRINRCGDQKRPCWHVNDLV